MRLSRGYLIVLGCVALLGVWLQWPSAPPPAPDLEQPRYAKAATPPADLHDGVFAIAAPATPASANHKAPSAAYAGGTPTPPPFVFLGRIMDQGESVVLLYHAGRTLKVRGTGRIADDYEVDALADNLVWLRHLPSWTQQVIELTARDVNPLVSDPEDSPRD